MFEYIKESALEEIVREGVLKLCCVVLCCVVLCCVEVVVWVWVLIGCVYLGRT